MIAWAPGLTPPLRVARSARVQKTTHLMLDVRNARRVRRGTRADATNADDTSLQLVVEADGKVVGAIDEACRRQGVGTRLVEAAEEWGRSAGARIADTSTYYRSPLSLPFWKQRMGYEEESVNLRKLLQRHSASRGDGSERCDVIKVADGDVQHAGTRGAEAVGGDRARAEALAAGDEHVSPACRPGDQRVPRRDARAWDHPRARTREGGVAGAAGKGGSGMGERAPSAEPRGAGTSRRAPVPTSVRRNVRHGGGHDASTSPCAGPSSPSARAEKRRTTVRVTGCQTANPPSARPWRTEGRSRARAAASGHRAGGPRARSPVRRWSSPARRGAPSPSPGCGDPGMRSRRGRDARSGGRTTSR